MATKRSGSKQRERGAMGTDDIQRGNTGTGDQGPGDVYPSDKINARTTEIEPHPMGRKPAKKT